MALIREAGRLGDCRERGTPREEALRRADPHTLHVGVRRQPHLGPKDPREIKRAEPAQTGEFGERQIIAVMGRDMGARLGDRMVRDQRGEHAQQPRLPFQRPGLCDQRVLEGDETLCERRIDDNCGGEIGCLGVSPR